ncbi:2-oxoadipate dioxygenase/decarboxylase HglS [Pseudomonas rhodesiae]|uniref:2-oxoadipate dioxygenase/decarboxylase HglS n=1 Tax=Pseudomonas rhodesiae TaxID=76760 RepID=UPI003D315DF8
MQTNTQSEFISPDDLRAMFSQQMSDMYKAEVLQYSTLLSIVEDVNENTLSQNDELHAALSRTNDLDRLTQEYHGAIRLGTAQELATMRRMFRILGMLPVDYYDLSVAGVPVHATAFRPVSNESLAKNPFRIFTSLLRLELIDNLELRATAERILSGRNIFTGNAIELLELAEQQGGLSAVAGSEFVSELIETFRWHSEATVDAETFDRLQDAHRLVADVVCFRGPHINHLTPRTLDIDQAQAEMPKRGVQAKQLIEGPPRRNFPILLRQTSFKALEERMRFVGADCDGAHTARFGEIEQRGAALTPKGMALYDELLSEARRAIGAEAVSYESNLKAVFKKFPDSLEDMRIQELAYFKYSAGPEYQPEHAQLFPLEDLLSKGLILADPIIYEDFLPVSAAGIFQSNLGGTEQKEFASNAAKDSFERALGSSVLDKFQLYEHSQRESLAMLGFAL